MLMLFLTKKLIIIMKFIIEFHVIIKFYVCNNWKRILTDNLRTQISNFYQYTTSYRNTVIRRDGITRRVRSFAMRTYEHCWETHPKIVCWKCQVVRDSHGRQYQPPPVPFRSGYFIVYPFVDLHHLAHSRLNGTSANIVSRS